jgi:hypothetical protein
MRPIEIIHSLERLAAARDVQSHPGADPHAADGELTLRKIRDQVELRQNSVPETEEQTAVDPDAENKKGPARKRPEKKPDSKEDSSSGTEHGPGDDDPDRGNIVDIEA